MLQLVGRACVHCRQRISSEADGRFCPACASPVHNACATGAGARKDAGACPSCGAPVAAQNRAAEARSEAERTAANAVRNGRAGRARGTLGAYTAFCGVYFLVKLSSGPVEVLEAAITLGLALAVLVIAILVWLFR